VQDVQRARAVGVGHEQMVVVPGGDHVAADPGLGQGRRDGGGEAHRLQCRVHFEGQPRGDVVEGQPGLFCLGAGQDQRQPFAFTEAAQRLQAGGYLPVGQGAVDVFAVIEHRGHVAQQRGQGGFASHEDQSVE